MFFIVALLLRELISLFGLYKSISSLFDHEYSLLFSSCTADVVDVVDVVDVDVYCKSSTIRVFRNMIIIISDSYSNVLDFL